MSTTTELNDAVMGAGKTERMAIDIFQSTKVGKNVLVFKHVQDVRSKEGFVEDRAGHSMEAITVGPEDDLYEIVSAHMLLHPHTAYLDEIHFFQEHHFDEMVKIATKLNVNVKAFGLTTDYTGELFKVFQKKLKYFDHVNQFPQVLCACGQRLATMHLKTIDGKIVREGKSIEVGHVYTAGMDVSKGILYYPVCISCWSDGTLPIVEKEGEIVMLERYKLIK